MKTYFLSSKPCVLTINGAYFGVTDRFGRFAELSLKDGLFAKFTPEGGLPVSFFLSEEIRFRPPKGVEVYLFKDSLVLYAKEFPTADFSLRVIAQERFDDTLVTLFYQGSVQLSIERKGEMFNATLPPSFEKATLSKHGNIFFVENGNQLLGYDQNGKCVLNEEVLSYTFDENSLQATLPLFDSQSGVVDCEWELSENIRQTKRSVLVKSKEIAKRLLPYVFFESILIGGNFEKYLSDELLPEKENLKGFIGNFNKVCLTDDPLCCALLKKKKDRLFEAVYFTVEVENGKITDVKK